MGTNSNRSIKLWKTLTVCSVCLVGCGGSPSRDRSFSPETRVVPAVEKPQSFGQRATSDVRLGSHIRIASKPVLVNVQVDVGHESDMEYVYRILGEIEKRGWSATVYFTGQFAVEHPDIVKDIHDRRHQIAVGGWTTGEDLTLLSYQEQLDFISESFTAVRKAINNFHSAYVADFKPQGLEQNEDTFKALQQLRVRSNAGFLASETKSHPYHMDYGFIAIPTATVKDGSEDVPLIDEVIFERGASVRQYHDYLKKRYDESLVTKEPFTIVVRSSVTGSDEAKLESFTRFLDHVKETNGQVVMTDHVTTIANPYMTDLEIFLDPSFDPNKVYSGNNVLISGNYYAHCDCPNYYIRIYGKYPRDASWQPLHGGEFVQEEPPLGKREFAGLITIPYSPCNDPNYLLLAVGRACHGDCWPTQDSYEQKYELKLKLKNPMAGERINGIVRTDVPGVDRYCPGRGQCVELKPGDLLFREWQPWVNIPPIVVRGPFEHAGIYVGNGWILESVPESGVRLNRIYLFDSFDAPWKNATTVVGFKGLCPCDEKELRQEIIKEASWYYYNHTPFAKDAVQFLNPNPQKGQPLQCGQFVYMAYKPFRYDLRNLLGWWWPAIAPVDVRSRTSGEMEGSGGLGRDSYSRTVDPAMERWPQPMIRKIYPGGAFSENVLVDPAISMIVFALGWEHNSSNLLLTIYDPNGVAVSDSDIVHERDEQLGGEYYIIETPKTGNWTMRVTAVNVPQEGENYTLSNYFASTLNVVPILEKQWYSPGELALISANLSDNAQSIPDLDFAAEVFKPNDSNCVVPLYDDGSQGDIQPNDGVYSALFTETSIEGIYYVKINTNGTVAGDRFERESYESFYVRRQTAEIISCSDGGSDTSGDGLFDVLGLNVLVNTIQPGDYRLTASLYDNSTTLIDRVSQETHLDAGWFRRVKLDFDGMAICGHKADGPYRVDVGIYDVNGIQMDYKEGYSTAPYNYRDFQCGGQITGIVSDPNGQPVEDAYLYAIETGATILSDDFDNNRLDPRWSRWPPGPRFSFAETNGEIKIDRVSAESGWNNFRYNSPVNQDVEASIRVRTPNLPKGTGFSFFVFQGGPGSQYQGPEWGHYEISQNNEGYLVSGYFHGKDYWGSGSMSLFGDEAENFHTYKIIYEKSKKRMSFLVDDAFICTIEDVHFIDFNFEFGANCGGLGRDAEIDVRVDEFLVKEFTGFAPEIKGTAFTDPNGAYAIRRLLPATYKISVVPPEGAKLLRDSAVVALDRDETETANFVLQEGGIVTGCVRDSNGVTVRGAHVEASGPEHVTSATDPNGIYELTGLESRRYNISISPSPYANLMGATASVQAVAGETKIADFTLQPAGSIAGKVTDANGTPITDVYLFLSGEEMPRYSVDENGHYIISGLHAGTYTINTDAVETEFLDDSRTVDVRLGQTTTADFVLQKGRVYAKISGYVVTTSGDPLSNVPVEIQNLYNEMAWAETTNEDGYFEFQNVPASLYGVRVNDGWPKLVEYTWIELEDEDAVNVTEDLVMYFTLWRVEIKVGVDSSRTYANGDTIDVELTTTNRDIRDLADWEAMVELGYDNDVDEVLDSKVFPISVAVGRTKVVIVPLKIPQDNTHSELYLEGEIRNSNLIVNSNIGPLSAKTKQDLYLDGIIKVRARAVPKPLNVTKAVSGEAQGQIARVDGNAPFTYTICFANNDNNFPVTDVSVVDILPDEVSFVSSDADKAGGRYDPAVHTYTWSYGFLESGASVCLGLVVKVNPGVTLGTIITNSVVVDSSETPPSTASTDAMVYRAGGPVSR